MSSSRARTHWYVFAAQVLIIAALAVRSSHLTAAAEESDPPGRMARLSDVRGSVSFINLDDGTVRMQLTEGAITVRVQRMRRDEVVEVATPNQAFSLLQAGSYRVEASEDGAYTLVTVRAGEGEVSGGGETYTIHSGQSVRLTGTDRLVAADLALDPARRARPVGSGP